MARLNIIVCDLCGTSQKTDLEGRLTIKFGDIKPHKAEICEVCVSDLLTRLNSDKVLQTPKPSIKPKVLDNGEVIVPSALTNEQIKHSNQKKPVCAHERTSFEESHLVCKDCGDRTPV